MAPNNPDFHDDDDRTESAASDFSQLETAAVPGKIATQLRELMAAAGIPLHRQRAHVATVLNVSPGKARRMLIGETSWNESEISLVLNSIDLEWTGLDIVYPAKTRLIRHVGEITVEGIRMPCDVFESPNSMPPPRAADALCIQGDGPQVAVVRSTNALQWSKLRTVKSIHIHPTYMRTGPRVAILDDSAQIVEGMMQGLAMSGFRTEAFTSPAVLLERSQVEPGLDAYLLDWSLQNGENISAYIPALRKASPRAAIILMSANFDTPEIDAEATLLSTQYNLTLLPKPSPVAAITQNLMMSIKFTTQQP